MEVLVMRHGQAVEEAAGLGDAGRWLTVKGRKTTGRVARWLARRRKRCPAAIWTSPLVRAVQTAEILAAETGYAGELRACSELNPGRDPGDLLGLLQTYEGPGPVALVGHEPFVSHLITALLGQDPQLGAVKKSAIVAIAWEGGVGTLRFVFDPAEMKREKHKPAVPPAPPNGAAEV